MVRHNFTLAKGYTLASHNGCTFSKENTKKKFLALIFALITLFTRCDSVMTKCNNNATVELNFVNQFDPNDYSFDMGFCLQILQTHYLQMFSNLFWLEFKWYTFNAFQSGSSTFKIAAMQARSLGFMWINDFIHLHIITHRNARKISQNLECKFKFVDWWFCD